MQGTVGAQGGGDCSWAQGRSGALVLCLGVLGTR